MYLLLLHLTDCYQMLHYKDIPPAGMSVSYDQHNIVVISLQINQIGTSLSQFQYLVGYGEGWVYKGVGRHKEL